MGALRERNSIPAGQDLVTASPAAAATDFAQENGQGVEGGLSSRQRPATISCKIKNFGRATWKQWTRYHVQSRIEAKMRCLKFFGERIASSDPNRQTAELQIRITGSTLRTAEVERVA